MSAIPPYNGGVDLSDTALRRMLRRIIPFAHPRVQPLTTHNRLMEASERRLAEAAHSGIPMEEILASRILDSPTDFRRWEDEHALLMRRVVVEHGSEAQKIALRSAALALIHRKALFEYLRDHKVRGGDRQRLLAQFHGGSDYASSVVAEHGNYLRSAASFMCSCHVGRRVMLDTLFDDALARYEEAFMEYFGTFCDAALARNEDQAGAYARSLLAPLKQQANDLRLELLGSAPARSGTWRRLNATSTAGVRSAV